MMIPCPPLAPCGRVVLSCRPLSSCPQTPSRIADPSKEISSMANLPADSDTAEAMPRSRVVSYAMGDVANNVSFQMTSLFLMAYMTDIAGVPAAVAGTIYGVTKVWAGVTDLVAGNTVGRKETKWGRLRPWIVGVSPFLSISVVMLFSTPAGLSPIGDRRVDPPLRRGLPAVLLLRQHPLRVAVRGDDRERDRPLPAGRCPVHCVLGDRCPARLRAGPAVRGHGGGRHPSQVHDRDDSACPLWRWSCTGSASRAPRRWCRAAQASSPCRRP